MINLLPPEQIAANRHLYRARRYFLVGALIFSWFLIAGILLGSAYVLARTKRLARQEALVARQAEMAQGETLTLERSWRRLAEETVLLATVLDQPPGPTFFIGRVLAERPEGVRLTGLSFRDDGTIALLGVADERRQLLNFLDRLKAEPVFLAVESPVANLIHERDAPFTLTLFLDLKHEAE